MRPIQLRFKGYSLEEITPNPPTFELGDILELESIGNDVSYDALNVVRLSDGTLDFVWPEEVEAI